MADASRSEKVAAARKKLKQFQKKTNRNKNDSLIEENDKKLPESKNSVSFTSNIIVQNQDSIEQISRNKINEINTDNQETPNSHLLNRTISSSEKLRQISSQLNGLMSQTHGFLNGETDEIDYTNQSELEKRNEELSALLEKTTQAKEHFESQIQELKNTNFRLQQQLQQEQRDLEERHFKEQGSLKEQLQVHIQTIGILVAEKTELQASLTQSQQTAKQKAAEVEELQGRLKASRHRGTDLEREFNNLTTTNQQLEKASKEHSREIDRLKMEAYKTNKQLEDLRQQNSELTEKLNEKVDECHSLRKTLDETSNKLSMTEVYAQQLSRSSNNENIHIIEELNQEKIQLEKKISQLKESVQSMTQERDSLSEQYQQFSEHLNQQLKSLSEQVTSLTEEKVALSTENSKLSSRVNSLEDKLESQSKHEGTNLLQNHEVEKLKEEMEFIRNEKNQLQDQYEKQIGDNAQLSQIVEELEARILHLESEVVNSQQEKFDKKQLLDEIQSDKVAASRALSQNRELKKQLEELQNGFIIMSNNKLELVEKLESEQNISKELGERLLQQEEEIKEIRHQFSVKERELELSKKSSTELTKQMYQQQQLVDRVRHYEAQGQLSDLLQQELDQTKERLNSIMVQNNELRTMLAQQAQQVLQSSEGNSEKQDSSKKDDMVASLSASVHQLEMERDQLLSQLGEQQDQRELFRAQLKEMKENKLNQINTNGEVVSSEEYDHLKTVLHQLETRFTKTMKDIAELTDQKQQLEHLVTQLQGETDTIGEYIALYQVQRGLMKQRALEKDEYIAQLARDREDLKSKLTDLQSLVMKLMYERQQYQENGMGDSFKPPGRAISTLGTSSEMSALNDMSELPEWPDILDDFTKSESNSNNPSPVPQEEVLSSSSKKSNDTTAKKIMDLISEIGSSSLVEKPVLDTFHPCPLCSGKLMTI